MIIDFNRININEREQMMGGDRINDVALKSICHSMKEQVRKSSTAHTNTNRSGKMAFILVYGEILGSME